MANEFNGSSYYRANPYYQQGYIPDGALKNRRPPHQMGEIPQGEQFFEPTNKKHFQRLGYYSTIADQKIIHSDEPHSNYSPAKEKDYFRSLNINDIEGATTNTLISKAVKNRMKAQEELSRRAQQQKESETYQKMRMLERIEHDKKQMEALNILKKKSQPNYHELTKRMRTQERQKLAAKNKASYNNQGQNVQYRTADNKLAAKDAIQTYQEQLQQAEKEIKQLQMQLSQVKSQKEKAQNDYQERYRQQTEVSRQDHSRNIAPVTYEKEDSYRPSSRQYYQQSKNDNPEQYYNYSPNSKLQLSPQEMQYLASQRQRQEKIGQSYQRDAGNMNNERPMNERLKLQQRNVNTEMNASPQALSGRQNREQHRRFNPTFLSYGSPSIGLAGKNIVGY